MPKESGELLFDRYYRSLYQERWDSLKEALTAPPSYASLKTESVNPYFLDEASLAVAKLISRSVSDNFIDLCAAPGGKALGVALNTKKAPLVFNEFSAARRGRLVKVLKEHLPQSEWERMTITGYDASRWILYEKEIYSTVLLDAPCSGERHLAGSERELKKWTPGRTKNLSFRQYALLSSAFGITKKGGSIYYVTCSLSPLENDGVIAKLKKKRGELFKVEEVNLPWGEKSEFGTIILPDKEEGRGPLYVCKIVKK